ncbi:MAG: hypothetical protein DCC75_07885 [Proteobacteria bacterium]|nr:MAG: hypothetical protein DCC75_07885 [Pseudomonadota bacterium]
MGYRRTLIRFFTFLGGIYFFLKFVLPEHIGGSPSPQDPNVVSGGFKFSAYDSEISNGFVLVGTMALGLGLINILMVHGSKLAFLRKGWLNSLALLFGLVLMLIVSGREWVEGERSASSMKSLAVLREFHAKSAESLEAGSESAAYLQNLRTLSQEIQNRLNVIAQQAAAPFGTELEVLAEQTTHPLIHAANEMRERATDLSSQLMSMVIAEDRTAGFLLAESKKLDAALAALNDPARRILELGYRESLTKKIYDFLFSGLFISLGAAMFSLLGFYIAAAAYRAFRMKSPESALMMTAALVVMLGQIPFGIWIWDEFPALRLWLLQVPSAAASRAIEIGAAVAGLVMAFRMWLSIESESFK